ncbi:hypothetical protein BCR35DRAFT_309877 [Leucosporidium creatinivorum]|uniref:Uncharacterized protein n=1 Tax=Leucosporidium creatinivorum TaxID=106004 RepID=A0A1Y2DAP1_9BASI|nr:hypothetical protein BCR35DRAFT_309877 [Leucosporidium creatinivorum]
MGASCASALCWHSSSRPCTASQVSFSSSFYRKRALLSLFVLRTSNRPTKRPAPSGGTVNGRSSLLPLWSLSTTSLLDSLCTVTLEGLSTDHNWKQVFCLRRGRRARRSWIVHQMLGGGEAGGAVAEAATRPAPKEHGQPGVCPREGRG